MVIQVAISWAGYKAIATFERWTVPPTIVVLIAMSVVAWTQLDIDWGYAGPAGQVLTGTARWVAMSGVMTAIGIGWGITWFTYAADYSRFVSREVPKRKLYLASTLGQFIPVVWLGILGATLATKNGSLDPGALIVGNFGALAIPVLLLVIHGPDRHQHPEHLHLHRRRPGPGRQGGPPQTQPVRRCPRDGCGSVLHLPGQPRQHARHLADRHRRVDRSVGRHHARPLLQVRTRRSRTPVRLFDPPGAASAARTSTGRPWPRLPWACSRPGCSSTV